MHAIGTVGVKHGVVKIVVGQEPGYGIELEKLKLIQISAGARTGLEISNWILQEGYESIKSLSTRQGNGITGSLGIIVGRVLYN